MARDTLNPVLFFTSLFVAFVLAVAPLPDMLNYARPEWISLIMFYWVIRYPHIIGIIACWCIGLCWDVLIGGTLGVHALALALQAYLILSMLQRLQMFPPLQQIFVVFIIVGISVMLYRWISGFVGVPARGMAFILPAFSSALIWPVVKFVLSWLDTD